MWWYTGCGCEIGFTGFHEEDEREGRVCHEELLIRCVWVGLTKLTLRGKVECATKSCWVAEIVVVVGDCAK